MEANGLLWHEFDKNETSRLGMLSAMRIANLSRSVIFWVRENASYGQRQRLEKRKFAIQAALRRVNRETSFFYESGSSLCIFLIGS